MKKSVFLSFCFITCLFGKTIEIIPSDHNSVHSLFTVPLSQSFENLGFWEKIQFLIEKEGNKISTTDLADIPKKRKKIEKYLPWKKLKKNVDKIIVFNLPYYLHSQKIYNLPKEKLILFMLEPPTIVPDQYNMEKMKRKFHKIYTFDDSLVDNKQIFKFYYPVCNVKECIKEPFLKKKFLCTISANKTSDNPNELYTERKKAIEFFSNKGLDLFGYGWEKEEYECCRGSIENKIKVLKNYKFSICYENMKNINGYVSEKIFDCFEAGCVPIYLGASNIEDYIPKGCFIDKRDFTTYEDLDHYIRNLSEEDYRNYIHAIDQFLSSEKAACFKPENLINLIAKEANS